MSAALEAHHTAHHFDSAEQEFESSKLGMWLFLASEIMMFGGLFVGAIVFFTLHREAFSEGSRALDWRLGALNMFFLLTSGFTMAMAVFHAQGGRQDKVRLNLLASIALALCFLVTKTVEYGTKFEHGTLPGSHFHGHGFHDPYAHIFFGLYFVMTGLHALHVIIGMGLMVWCFIRSLRTRFDRGYFTPVEMVALYWALVDLVWIFLYPLLYLVG